MQLMKTEAVELFAALGVKTAAKWPLKRLVDKLSKVSALVDEDTALDGELVERLNDVLAAGESGEAFEVLTPAAVKRAKAKLAEAGKKAAKEKATPTPTPTPDTAPEPDTAPKPIGVRKGVRTRPYVCGEVITQYGLDAGVTLEMVEQVDATYADGTKANPHQTWFCLRQVWAGINGYLDTQATKAEG
jgi:hypothetical protein